MSLVFSIPGKTFIAGEYLAVKAGPALVFSSSPCFKVKIARGQGSLGSIHADSPAGKFASLHKEFFSGFDILFEDPYQGIGGFGASTAQFIALYAFWLMKEAPQQDMQSLLDVKAMLEAYYQVAWNGLGTRPSGADLVGQYKGSFTFFDKQSGLISVAAWPFEQLDFFILHTGNKIPTHEHLKTLGDFDARELQGSFEVIRRSFHEVSPANFITGIESYAAALKSLGFTSELTLKLLEKIKDIPGVCAAKGCGALGADVILVITEKNKEQGLLAHCLKQELALISSSKKVSSGLSIEGVL